MLNNQITSVGIFVNWKYWESICLDLFCFAFGIPSSSILIIWRKGGELTLYVNING